MIRVARIGAGFALLLAGIVMLALPGPGWLTIAAGLGVLATEYTWAARWFNHLKDVGKWLRRAFPSGSHTSWRANHRTR
jgi:uncharacterized protein (TIGR02611 family)